MTFLNIKYKLTSSLKLDFSLKRYRPNVDVKQETQWVCKSCRFQFMLNLSYITRFNCHIFVDFVCAC